MFTKPILMLIPKALYVACTDPEFYDIAYSTRFLVGSFLSLMGGPHHDIHPV
jgi:hypothetical protein